jgi:MarR family multiple antibiotic resistance transcriptional regulator
VEFFDVLVRYEVMLWGNVDQELGRQHEVSLATLHALRVLDRHAGRARVQDLSDDIGITVGAASKFMDRLESAGLAARRPNPANRRSSLLTLTSAGQEALASAAEVCSSAVSQALGDEDVDTLTTALRRLQSRLVSRAGVVSA